MSQPCLVCAGAVGSDGAALCGGCARRHVVATTPMRTTGEFTAPSAAELAAHAAGSPAASVAGCSWCGKEAASTRKLLGNGQVAICDECVALCADVLDAELGDGWRG